MQMARGLQAAGRRHELSSDQRAGVWARTRAREAHLRVVRRMWMPLLVIGLGGGALGGLCVWVISNAVVRAYAAGLLTTTVVGYLLHQITQMAGANSALMGELAEQWTAQELRKLRRRGWRVVNHLMLRNWDIDHVLVGPGGVIAVETKWSAQPWEFDPPEGRILTAVQQVKQNARDLSLWQPIKASGAASASGVVVLWGQSAEASEARAPKRFDDVVVVTGRTIDDWRHSLPSVGLTDSQVEACWRALESQVRVRDLREGRRPTRSGRLACATSLPSRPP